ncbi:uncharacterized protein Z520_10769 [Fonsecaea multimorphosa CBS 102226]|uniref:Ribosomal RNA-processing protein 8 n=1 Tax=Fonsecaea multimorphosa CBS 102226 TaxID=1442371 RepID=A0A0D2I8S0_9EURO|nr:uncharacterized protein Z520_10769 [Fonsecaea multimorphosa CBS 102226]KIX93591.1 hypothetical protein Z520_10769 [Fonsecaea multimorphosa CBS 102226]OAL18903.1 hypothetical protein AYO22_10232 [Fonsecaea multimorphosa]
MFAVPGWAVDSNSLAQEKPAPTGDAHLSHPVSTSSSKKRRNTFSDRPQASKVSGIELEKLWNQRAGAKPARTEQAHGRQGDGHQKGDRNKAGAETIPTTDRKRRRRENKDNTRSPPNVQQLSGQDDRRRTSRDGDQRNSRGDAETSSSRPFPRDALHKALPPEPPLPAKLTPLQAKMRSKLTAARFRHLNETLYTTTSLAAMDLFTNSPDLFAEYHAGFSQQVKDSWPVNPVDKYISAIRTRGQIPTTANESKKQQSSKDSKIFLQNSPLPRRKTGSCTIADLGCGDAPLARGCQSAIKALKLKFHNFDLHTPNTFVTKADISSLPLRDGEVDIAVFCLSLMGTNWINFVEEAWRILRGDGKGECWVSEVKSRFGRAKRQPGQSVENSVGKKRRGQQPKKKSGANGAEDGDDEVREELFAEDSTTPTEATGEETDISAFVRVLSRRGFLLREESVDKSNKMFVSMVFVKSGVPTAGKYKGLKWNGREYQKIEEVKLKGRGRGADHEADDREVTAEEEAKVLKPCVYKTR